MLTTRVKSILAALCALAGLFFLTLSLVNYFGSATPEAEVATTQRKLYRQLARLESYVDNPDRKLPAGMVIYQYQNDSLVHWRNLFPVENDDMKVNETVWSSGYKLYAFSGRQYLARRIERDDRTEIVGYRLELEHLILPSGNPRGLPVRYNGRVLFKYCVDNPSLTESLNINHLWAMYVFLIMAILFYLLANPGIRRLMLSVSGIVVLTSSLYIIGYLYPSSNSFSALHYSGNRVFYSLNVIPLLNVFVFAILSSLSITRQELSARLPSLDRGSRRVISITLIFLMLAYVHLSLKNLILNTDMVLAFINLSEMTIQGFLIALSYLTVLTMIAMLIRFGCREINIWEQVGMSLILSLYLVVLASYFTTQKERGNLKVAAATLALNRDLKLEASLIKSEPLIQNDTFLLKTAFNIQDYSAANHLVQTYFYDISANYDIVAFVATDNENGFIQSMNKTAVRIAPGSHFYHIQNYAISRYMASFYYSQGTSVRTLLIVMDQRRTISSVRQTELHPKYSYARYHDGLLASFRGQYSYPTVETESLRSDIKYKHFVYDFGDRDQIVVTRRRIGFGSYLSSIIFCAVLFLALMIIFGEGSRFVLFRQRNYFERNLLFLSEALVMATLIIIVSISIFFIYLNNKNIMRTLIAERIGALQSVVQRKLNKEVSPQSLYLEQTGNILDLVSGCTETALTLYSTDGQLVVTSSRPTVDVMPPFRIPESVKIKIVDEYQRYHFVRNSYGRTAQFEMYAPIFDKSGNIVAILRSPYYGIETFEMENDAVMHIVTLLSFLLVLLILARFITEKFYKKLLDPLNVLSGKMQGVNLDHLEHIQYDRQDEISNIIDSYNLMVDQLERSTRQLAEAERNQAWTGMARQVAHEIKNPLTPMKLQIQRVVRLKEKGDPSWQEKMKEASEVLLDHINVLTQTADEFSSFAKLYSEAHTRINVDEMMRRELSMFTSREDITFEYNGLPEAWVSGPKPQLTRVFVNLINNAIQAVDCLPEQAEKIIRISLNRQSEGMLQIVFQDNGPGVSAENLKKLFTPNFTTKNAGSGLGLAISKSVLDKCGASISYARSFDLGGASFSILYPAES